MKMKKWVACLFVVSATLFAGCGSKEPQTMKLTLESNPTTGYSWILTQDPELFEASDQYLENKHEDGLTGVGGHQIFTLIPEQTGTTELTFTYARPWEDSEADSTQISYTVEINNRRQIKVTAMKYAGGNDIDEIPLVPEPVIE